jgi:C4-type Zn-finger protein
VGAPDRYLMPCPSCGRWPMAINLGKPFWGRKLEVRYACSQCGHREVQFYSLSQDQPSNANPESSL